MSKILVAGIPRSGTTWVGRVAGLAEGTTSLHEPDNELRHPYAIRAKRQVGRFPILAPGELAPGFERLWSQAFGGRNGGLGAKVLALRNRVAGSLLKGLSLPDRQRALGSSGQPVRIRAAAALAAPAASRRSPNVVVKSVHTPLALEWVADRFAPAVVLVVRHPFNLLASWMELQLPDRDRHLDRDPRVRERYLDRWGNAAPDSDASDLARSAWQFGLFTAALEEQAARHPEWVVVAHEDLCVDPDAGFRSLFDRLGLTWTDRARAFLAESDRPGAGFSTNRVAALEPTRWRQRLSRDQAAVIADVLEPFGLSRWDLRADAASATERVER